MFGFKGGETSDTVIRKKGYLADAQKKWNFLTHYDLSTIKTKGQLCNMIKIRRAVSEEEAVADVEKWMAGKDFS
ncbi:hypothetical protein [Thalassospira profundimaris]|uniref:Uncharacterized protein n=1 Tax=Thalassospira profundimaris TaxID=502049 RepID=A0A367WQ05_9PROT|nr:hypothetical protein [Thalassospira profundimaris]RCK43545.1 hypothetical protein TH30_18180 [Thalassospira profundimaris]